MRELLDRIEEEAKAPSDCSDVRCVELEDWLKKRYQVQFVDIEGKGARRKATYFLTAKGRRRGSEAPDATAEVFWAKVGETKGRRIEVVSLRPDWVTRDRATFVTPKDLKAMESWIDKKIKQGKQK